MKAWKWILRALAIGLVITIVGSWWMASQLIAPHHKPVGAPPAELQAELLAFDNGQGVTIKGWHVDVEESRGVVLLLHGLGGSRWQMVPRAKFLQRAGYSSVLIDLRAHGESEGDEIGLGWLERHDVRATYEFAREAHPGEPVFAVASSLGGASLLLTEGLELDGVVLEAVYSRIRPAVRNRVALRSDALSGILTELLLVQLRPRLGVSEADLAPIDGLAKLDCPVLIMAGAQDVYTPASETREMFAAANEPKELWLLEGVGHFDLQSAAPSEYERRVLALLERAR